jgi:hypothetical protein
VASCFGGQCRTTKFRAVQGKIQDDSALFLNHVRLEEMPLPVWGMWLISKILFEDNWKIR